MELISAFILGVIQGLTEFLPISSSGHLVIASTLLNYNAPGLLLEAVVHIATLLAIVIYFRKRIVLLVIGFIYELTRINKFDWARTSGPSTGSIRLLVLLSISFLCTGVVFLIFKGWAINAFETPIFVGVMFIGTSLVLISTRFTQRSTSKTDLLSVGVKIAIVIGIIQGLAVFPGISRSGVTIAAALWAGQNNQSAAEYSFFLAIPTIIAASIYSFWNVSYLSMDISVELMLAAGVALLVGLISIHWLMRWMRQGRLWWFSGYCAFVGVISIAGSFMGII